MIRDSRRGSPKRGRGGDSPRDRRRRKGSLDSLSDRDDRKSSRRDTRRGGRGDEEDMIDTMTDIFKDLLTVHEMIKRETDDMRGHKSMSRSKKYDDGDARLDRRLKKGRSAAETLNNLAKDVQEVKKYLNKDFRKNFFENVCDDSGSRRRRGDSEDRDRGRGGRGDRDRGRGDRDRGRGDRDRGTRDRDDRDRGGRGDRDRGSRRDDRRSRDDRDSGRRDDRDRRR